MPYPPQGAGLGDMTKAVYDPDANGRIGKGALEIALNKLLKGAGADADPTEIEIGTGAGTVAAGDHTHSLTVTEEWAALDRTTSSTSWVTVDTATISSAKKIVVWGQGLAKESYQYTETGYLRILLDDVEKISVGASGGDTGYTRYGAAAHFSADGGTVTCQVKRSGYGGPSGGRRGMYSVGV